MKTPKPIPFLPQFFFLLACLFGPGIGPLFGQTGIQTVRQFPIVHHSNLQVLKNKVFVSDDGFGLKQFSPQGSLEFSRSLPEHNPAYFNYGGGHYGYLFRTYRLGGDPNKKLWLQGPTHYYNFSICGVGMVSYNYQGDSWVLDSLHAEGRRLHRFPGYWANDPMGGYFVDLPLEKVRMTSAGKIFSLMERNAPTQSHPGTYQEGSFIQLRREDSTYYWEKKVQTVKGQRVAMDLEEDGPDRFRVVFPRADSLLIDSALWVIPPGHYGWKIFNAEGQVLETHLQAHTLPTFELKAIPGEGFLEISLFHDTLNGNLLPRTGLVLKDRQGQTVWQRIFPNSPSKMKWEADSSGFVLVRNTDNLNWNETIEDFNFYPEWYAARRIRNFRLEHISHSGTVDFSDSIQIHSKDRRFPKMCRVGDGKWVMLAQTDSLLRFRGAAYTSSGNPVSGLDAFLFFLTDSLTTPPGIRLSAELCGRDSVQIPAPLPSAAFPPPFRVELSDGQGSFALPRVLAEGVTQGFAFRMPESVPDGDQYQLRWVSQVNQEVVEGHWVSIKFRPTISPPVLVSSGPGEFCYPNQRRVMASSPQPFSWHGYGYTEKGDTALIYSDGMISAQSRFAGCRANSDTLHFKKVNLKPEIPLVFSSNPMCVPASPVLLPIRDTGDVWYGLHVSENGTQFLPPTGPGSSELHFRNARVEGCRVDTSLVVEFRLRPQIPAQADTGLCPNGEPFVMPYGQYSCNWSGPLPQGSTVFIPTGLPRILSFSVYAYQDGCGASGTYRIEIFGANTGPCVLTSVDREEGQNHVFRVVPNPSTGQIRLEGNFPSSAEPTFEVSDALGRTVLSRSYSPGSTQNLHLPPGLYWIRVPGQAPQKWVVEKN